MRRGHSMERIDRAEELFCVNGLSVQGVSAQLAISERTVRSWSVKYGWLEKKELIRKALSTIRIDIILLRAGLLEKCLTSLDPRDAFAVASLESTAKKRGPAAAGNCLDQLPEGTREISSEEDAISALNDAIKIKLNRSLADPGQLNFPAMRDLKKVMDLVGEMESRLSKTRGEGKDRDAGLSDEAAEEIRRKILGIQENPVSG